MARFLSLLVLLVFALPAPAASPVKARPLSGIGLLLVRGDARPLIVYREPKVGRLAVLAPAELPGLAPALVPDGGLYPVVVLSRRPGWLRIVHDPSESDGWVERRPAGEFIPWEQYLPRRWVGMVAGLRQDYYQVRRQASFAGEGVRTVRPQERLRVVAVAGDWLKVGDAATGEGWLRWRDDNARLAIRVLSPE
jgi:hypothetical protein